MIKLSSKGCRKVSSRGKETRRGLVWNLGKIFSQLAKWSTRMLVSGIFKQLRTFVVVPDVLSKFSKIGNVFFFRWSVWCQHQLKLYYIKRNDGKLLCVHHWSTEVYTREHSESVKQYARIVWASLISSLEVARYDCLPHRFSPTFQPPLFSVENWKKK